MASGAVGTVTVLFTDIEGSTTLWENTPDAMSVALARQMLWKMAGADHPMEAHKVDSKAIYWMGRSPDAYEGVSAFLEKRPAKFKLKPSEMPDFYPWWKPREFK